MRWTRYGVGQPRRAGHHISCTDQFHGGYNPALNNDKISALSNFLPEGTSMKMVDVEEAVASIRKDIVATVSGLIAVGVPHDVDGDVEVAVADAYGSRTGLPVGGGLLGAALVAYVADGVQEAAIEALWSEGKSAVWPSCPVPGHGHPLAATVTGDEAAWVCPSEANVIARVGDLSTGSNES